MSGLLMPVRKKVKLGAAQDRALVKKVILVHLRACGGSSSGVGAGARVAMGGHVCHNVVCPSGVGGIQAYLRYWPGGEGSIPLPPRVKVKVLSKRSRLVLPPRRSSCA